AALWAFWSDNGDFEKGVLAVVNLGDDTDTTAAIYGQLAGAYYGYEKLPKKWVEQVYAKTLISGLSKWMVYEGSKWLPEESATSTISSVIVESASRDGNQSSFERARCSSAQPWTKQDQKFGPNSSAEKLDATSNLSSKFEQLNSHNAGHRSRQNNLLQPDPLVRSTSNRRSTSSHPKPPQHDDLTSVSKRKSSKFLTDNIE
ncbi:unnamed protein product, partial [Rotaria sp. Silwood2]